MLCSTGVAGRIRALQRLHCRVEVALSVGGVPWALCGGGGGGAATW